MCAKCSFQALRYQTVRLEVCRSLDQESLFHLSEELVAPWLQKLRTSLLILTELKVSIIETVVEILLHGPWRKSLVIFEIFRRHWISHLAFSGKRPLYLTLHSIADRCTYANSSPRASLPRTLEEKTRISPVKLTVNGDYVDLIGLARDTRGSQTSISQLSSGYQSSSLQAHGQNSMSCSPVEHHTDNTTCSHPVYINQAKNPGSRQNNLEKRDSNPSVNRGRLSSSSDSAASSISTPPRDRRIYAVAPRTNPHYSQTVGLGTSPQPSSPKLGVRAFGDTDKRKPKNKQPAGRRPSSSPDRVSHDTVGSDRDTKQVGDFTMDGCFLSYHIFSLVRVWNRSIAHPASVLTNQAAGGWAETFQSRADDRKGHTGLESSDWGRWRASEERANWKGSPNEKYRCAVRVLYWRAMGDVHDNRVRRIWVAQLQRIVWQKATATNLTHSADFLGEAVACIMVNQQPFEPVDRQALYAKRPDATRKRSLRRVWYVYGNFRSRMILK